LDPRFAGSMDGFLGAIKICSTTSFEKEVKLGAHVVHLWHVKRPFTHDKR
jgi:hypothetical protein